MNTEKSSLPTKTESAHLKAAATPSHIIHATRDQAFRSTMQQARSHMNPAQRFFSLSIHTKIVGGVSDFIGGTLARPTALLGGSVAAVFAIIFTYSVARYFGYTLSGSESLIAFGVGWLSGCIIDYTRVLVRGGRLKNRRS